MANTKMHPRYRENLNKCCVIFCGMYAELKASLKDAMPTAKKGIWGNGKHEDTVLVGDVVNVSYTGTVLERLVESDYERFFLEKVVYQ